MSIVLGLLDTPSYMTLCKRMREKILRYLREKMQFRVELSMWVKYRDNIKMDHKQNRCECVNCV
jgi:hypothetical protein